MRIRPYQTGDAKGFSVQARQRAKLEDPSTVDAAAARGAAWTGIAEDGRVLGCAGIVVVEGRHLAWAVFADGWEAQHRAVFRFVRVVLEAWPSPLVAFVEAQDMKAARFACALGFSVVRSVSHEGFDALEMERPPWTPPAQQ